MAEHYSEVLDESVARLLLNDMFKPDHVYTLVTERDRMCVSAYDKETGEHVDLVIGEDGIGDDYKLEEEEIELCEEEIDRVKKRKITTTRYVRLAYGNTLYPYRCLYSAPL